MAIDSMVGHEVEPRTQHWDAPRAFVRAPGGHRVEIMAAPPGERGRIHVGPPFNRHGYSRRAWTDRSALLRSSADLFLEELVRMTRRRILSERPHPELRRSSAFTLRFVAGRMREEVAGALAEHSLTWVTYSVLLVLSESH